MNKKPPSRSKALPKRVRHLVARDRGVCGLIPPASLNRSEVAKLKEAVQRRRPLEDDLSLEHAVSTLAAVEPTHHVARTLGALAADGKAPLGARVAAAQSLRLVPCPTAQRHLIESLRSGQPRLRLQAIKSLGTFGDRAALTALRRLREPRETPAGKQLVFSKALIAYRLGMTEPALEFRRGTKRAPGKPSEMIELSLRPKLKKTVRADLERLRGSRFGIDVGERGFGLRAGRASWTVFVNREVEAAGGLGQIFERPWLMALLARWDFQTRTSTVQYVVLTTPAARSTEIQVARTDGEILYSGRATRGDGLFGFDMRDIERPGTAPTNVKGRLTTRGVQLDVTVPFGLRKNSRAGQAFTA